MLADFRRFILALAALALASCGAEGGDAPGLSSGQVILAAGDGEGPPSPDPRLADEGLYALHEIDLGGARGFTRADLTALSWRRIETDFPQGGETRVFEGPRLSDVLAAAGLGGQGVRLISVDGFQAEVTADLIERHEPVLAVRADGEPLSVGGLGPVMLVWPRRAENELADMNDDLWPWGVFAIGPLTDE